MHLKPAHSHGRAGGPQGELRLGLDRSTPQRPGDDGAEPLDREHAIDRQPRRDIGLSSLPRVATLQQRLPQGIEAVAGPCRHADDGRRGERRAGDEFLHVRLRHRLHRLVGQIAAGQGDHASADVEQPTDVEVLARLRHHGLVGRDDEQDGIDAADSREHRAHEALVTGHVHERQGHVTDGRVGEAEFDADAAGPLFRQPVGVGAGERLDERALAVVDMPGRGDGEVHLLAAARWPS